MLRMRALPIASSWTTISRNAARRLRGSIRVTGMVALARRLKSADLRNGIVHHLALVGAHRLQGLLAPTLLDPPGCFASTLKYLRTTPLPVVLHVHENGAPLSSHTMNGDPNQILDGFERARSLA